MKFLVTLLITLGISFGQSTTSLTLTAPPPPAETGISLTRVGNAGNATYYYWVVVRYAGGNSAVSPSAIITTAPNVLGVSNYVRVNWDSMPNATGYDVLRTTTAIVPNGNCNCAVTTNTSATTINDTGGALGAYTVTSQGGAITNCRIDNITVATPTVTCNPYSFAAGTVTSASVVLANGFAGTVATATTTPAITLSTTVTGVIKGNGTAISAAIAGTDYVVLGTAQTFTVAQTVSANGPALGAGQNLGNIRATGASGVVGFSVYRTDDTNGGWLIGTSALSVGDFAIYQNQGAGVPVRRMSINPTGTVDIPGTTTLTGISFTGTLTPPSGTAFTGTKSVRASGGLTDCTLVFSQGIMTTGGTC